MLIVAALVLAAIGSPPRDEDDERKVGQPAPKAAVPPSPPDNDDGDANPAALAVQAKAKAPDDDDEEERGVQPDSAIVVTARRLDSARTQIDAVLGASVYTLTNDAIENRPGGETGSIAAILLQAPGVTVSGTALTVRGSRVDQVRINNVIIPEAIGDPAERLSARLADTTRLISGTLPAQFGFAPAGVVSITTKNGLYQHGGQAELFAGTDGMIEPAIEWAGSIGGTSLFASGSFERSRASVADAAGIAARDVGSEVEGLGFADHVIDADNRISLIVGGSREHHTIGATAIGAGTQAGSDGYAVATFQHSARGLTVQASLFAGAAHEQTRFDEASNERRTSLGTQIDASQTIGASHTARFGVFVRRSTAREVEAGGIVRGDARRTTESVYAQDEWRLTPSLTLNPGARVEWLRGLGAAATLEPRASIVWTPGAGMTAHAGYARYASAPALKSERITTALPDERDETIDLGLQHCAGGLTLGIDGYLRLARNYLAERATPGSAVASGFAFGRARIKGIEFSAAYARKAVAAWFNVAVTSARGGTLIGGGQLFAPAAIAGAALGVPLATDRPVSGSGGVTYRLGRLSLSGDVVFSSGAVRTAHIDQPNGGRYPGYGAVGLAAVYHTALGGHPTDLRVDVENVTNVDYRTSDATSLEGGWTRSGRGRAIVFGIERGF